MQSSNDNPERYTVSVVHGRNKKYVCTYLTEPDWGGKIMQRYPKTYFIKKEWHEGYDDDDDECDSGEWQYVIVEAERLGQYYRMDEAGYEWPGLCWTLREVKRVRSDEAADAYIEGLKAGSGQYGSEPNISPLSSGVTSLGFPGKLPLYEDGGPLLFTLTSG